MKVAHNRVTMSKCTFVSRKKWVHCSNLCSAPIAVDICPINFKMIYHESGVPSNCNRMPPMYEFELTLYHFQLVLTPCWPKPRRFLLRSQQGPEKEWQECWTISDIQEGYSKKIFMCGKIVGQANMLARPSDPLTAPPPLSTDLSADQLSTGNTPPLS